MKICDLLVQDCAAFSQVEENKKCVLERLSLLIQQQCPDVKASAIFAGFIARERLGSTGIGHGIAIPHIRLAAATKPVGALLRLQHPIDFEASDDDAVDLIFALIVPAEADEEHLAILAQLAGLFSQAELRQQLRQTTEPAALRQILLNYHERLTTTAA